MNIKMHPKPLPIPTTVTISGPASLDANASGTYVVTAKDQTGKLMPSPTVALKTLDPTLASIVGMVVTNINAGAADADARVYPVVNGIEFPNAVVIVA